MSYFSEILMLGLVSIPLYWKDVLCRKNGFALNASLAVSVKEGQSVTISCHFTYPVLAKDHMAKLYGYWYEAGSNAMYDPAVATNDERKPIARYARKRFHLLGGLNQGVCSFIINNALETDQGTYFFRMEKGRTRFTYLDIQTTVTVTEAQKDILSEIFGPLSAAVSLLIGLTLIKIFLCSLVFFVAFWC